MSRHYYYTNNYEYDEYDDTSSDYSDDDQHFSGQQSYQYRRDYRNSQNQTSNYYSGRYQNANFYSRERDREYSQNQYQYQYRQDYHNSPQNQTSTSNYYSGRYQNANFHSFERDRKYSQNQYQYQYRHEFSSSSDESCDDWTALSHTEFVESCIKRESIPLLYCLFAQDRDTDLYFVKIGITNVSVESRAEWIPLGEATSPFHFTWCCKEDEYLTKTAIRAKVHSIGNLVLTPSNNAPPASVSTPPLQKPSLYRRKTQPATTTTTTTTTATATRATVHGIGSTVLTEPNNDPVACNTPNLPASVSIPPPQKPSLYRRKSQSVTTTTTTANHTKVHGIDNMVLTESNNDPVPCNKPNLPASPLQKPSLYRRKPHPVATTTSTTTMNQNQTINAQLAIPSLQKPNPQDSHSAYRHETMCVGTTPLGPTRISRQEAATTILRIEQEFIDICHDDYPDQAEEASQAFTWGGKTECVYVSESRPAALRAFQAISNRINFIYHDCLVKTNYQNQFNRNSTR